MYMETLDSVISRERFVDAQRKKKEEDFKYQTNQRLQKLGFSMDELSKSFDRLEATQMLDRNCLNSQMDKVKQETISNLEEFRQELGDIITAMNKMSDEISRCKAALHDSISKSDLQEKISLINAEIMQIRRENGLLRSEIYSLINIQTANFEKKVKDSKEEILAIPSEIPPLRKLLDQKIEICELNGQNSMLRSSNNERSIQLLEKKIENIYQLIKKIDITSQENK